eukprot:sb/3461677/
MSFTLGAVGAVTTTTNSKPAPKQAPSSAGSLAAPSSKLSITTRPTVGATKPRSAKYPVPKAPITSAGSTNPKIPSPVLGAKKMTSPKSTAGGRLPGLKSGNSSVGGRVKPGDLARAGKRKPGDVARARILELGVLYTLEKKLSKPYRDRVKRRDIEEEAGVMVMRDQRRGGGGAGEGSGVFTAAVGGGGVAMGNKWRRRRRSDSSDYSSSDEGYTTDRKPTQIGDTGGMSRNVAFSQMDKMDITKATNTACYGDSGRAPTFISAISRGLSYFERVMSKEADGSILGLAGEEQKSLNLNWYSFWENIRNNFTRTDLERLMINHWEHLRRNQSKLSYYNTVKTTYGYEEYLNLRRANRCEISKLRLSAHDLRVETSRYSNQQTPNDGRFCCDGQAKQLLDQLPLAEPLIENEQHVLYECPTYGEMRQTLPDHLLSAITSGEAAVIYTERNGNALNSSQHTTCRTVMSKEADGSILGLAGEEQKSLNLNWYSFWENIRNNFTRTDLERLMINHWEHLRRNQSKLSYYNTVKTTYGYEEYLNLRRANRCEISKLRLSAHDLRVETSPPDTQTNKHQTTAASVAMDKQNSCSISCHSRNHSSKMNNMSYTSAPLTAKCGKLSRTTCSRPSQAGKQQLFTPKGTLYGTCPRSSAQSYVNYSWLGCVWVSMFPASACVETSAAAVCVLRRKSIGFAAGQARGSCADLAVAGPICVFSPTVQDGTAMMFWLFSYVPERVDDVRETVRSWMAENSGTHPTHALPTRMPPKGRPGGAKMGGKMVPGGKTTGGGGGRPGARAGGAKGGSLSGGRHGVGSGVKTNTNMKTGQGSLQYGHHIRSVQAKSPAVARRNAGANTLLVAGAALIAVSPKMNRRGIPDQNKENVIPAVSPKLGTRHTAAGVPQTHSDKLGHPDSGFSDKLGHPLKELGSNQNHHVVQDIQRPEIQISKPSKKQYPLYSEPDKKGSGFVAWFRFGKKKR